MNNSYHIFDKTVEAIWFVRLSSADGQVNYISRGKYFTRNRPCLEILVIYDVPWNKVYNE